LYTNNDNITLCDLKSQLNGPLNYGDMRMVMNVEHICHRMTQMNVFDNQNETNKDDT